MSNELALLRRIEELEKLLPRQPEVGGVWTAYTPVCASSVGTITTYTSAGKYTTVGRICLFKANCNITTNGTGSSVLYIQRPPITPVAVAKEPFTMTVQNNSSGTFLFNGIALLGYSAGNITVQKYDGSYPGGDVYNILVKGFYEF